MEEEIVLMEENDIEEINIEEENYSGKPYELPIASKDVLGGIKVGENLTITEDGTLNAQAGGNNGSVVESNIGNFLYAHNSEKITIKPGGYAVLSLDKIVTDTTNGALISNENGEIIIGDGVSAILVLMNMMVWQSASKYLYLQKNGENVGVKSTGSSINLTDFICFTDVKKGDIIRGVVDIDSYVVNNYTKIIIMR